MTEQAHKMFTNDSLVPLMHRVSVTTYMVPISNSEYTLHHILVYYTTTLPELYVKILLANLS
jgi:hypothetical protein